MSEWPGSWSGRASRTQFQLGSAGRFLRGIHPVRGDIMDVGPSTAGLSADLVSSNKGTRTRTVREYEQTITELKKENFDLKLKIYMFEEDRKKNNRKDSDSVSQDNDNTVQVLIQLKSETDSLSKELIHKDKLLQEANELVEKYALKIQKLTKKCQDLQEEHKLLSEVPSKEEFDLLLREKEQLIEQNEILIKQGEEKTEELRIANIRIDLLATDLRTVEEKKKKCYATLKGFLFKNYQDKQLLPDEYKAMAASAVQAAKYGKKEDLIVALEEFKNAVFQCLEEESTKRDELTLPSQSVTNVDLSGIQISSSQFLDKSAFVTPEKSGLDCFIQNSFSRGTPLSENCLAEKEVVDFIDYSKVSPTIMGKTVPVSLSDSSLKSTFDDSNEINIEHIFAPTTPPISLYSSENVSDKAVSAASSDPHYSKLVEILEENSKLKDTLGEKSAIIVGLENYCEQLKSQALESAKLSDCKKALSVSNTSCQTDCSCARLNEVARLFKSDHLSDNINELQEYILLLLLTVEEKDKELTDAKDTLSSVQADLKHALDNNNQSFLNEECMNERNELHERLAFSCSVNNELMKHLRNLEAFLESLLQNKLDSSFENLSDQSSFLSNVSKCLNESLRLSNALSDHLSICEGSKLFEECKSMLFRSQSEETSLPNLDVSECNLPKYAAEINRGVTQMNFRHIGYPSSDSDIWSEPDRDVSMQRIGINVQISPKSTKSPRRLKYKDRRRLSADYCTSSSDVLHGSRHRQNGSTGHRLFAEKATSTFVGRESSKQQISMLENYHTLISEKFSRLKSLLNKVEIENENSAVDVSNQINSVMTSLEETLRKLQMAKDHAKNMPSITCGKCALLELLLNLKSLPKFPAESMSDNIELFQEEISSLKEKCDELFSLLPEKISKKSRSTQSVNVSSREDIKQSEEMLTVLKERNKKLVDSLDEVQNLLSKEKKLQNSLKAENEKLSKDANHLKETISELQNQIISLTAENKKLVENLSQFNEESSALKGILDTLEKTKTESDSKLDELAVELQKKKSELVTMSRKCEELENELLSLHTKKISKESRSSQSVSNQEDIGKLQEMLTVMEEKNKELVNSLDEVQNLLSEEKKLLESVKTENEKLTEDATHLKETISELQNKVNSLTAENKKLVENLSQFDEENSELKSILDALQKTKTESDSKLDELAVELQKNKSELINMSEKCVKLEKELSDQTKQKEEFEDKFKNLQAFSSNEIEKYINNIKNLNLIKQSSEENLDKASEKVSKLEKKISSLNEDLNSKNNEIKSLEEKLESLQILEKNLSENCLQLQSSLEISKKQCLNFQEKCNKYEEQLSQKHQEYYEQLKQAERQYLDEKREILDKISLLTTEKDDIIQEFKLEKEKFEQINKENGELKSKLTEDLKQISSLKSSKEKIENDHIAVMREKENIQKSLLATNSKCNGLGNDITQIQETMQNLEFKYSEQEKELVAHAEVKKILLDCLLDVKDELTVARQKILEMGKVYNISCSSNVINSDFVPLADEKGISHLCFDVSSDSKKLLNDIDAIFEVLKSFNVNSQDVKFFQEKHRIQIQSIKKQLDVQKHEIDHLQTQNDFLTRALEEKQKSPRDSRKFEKFNSLEIQSLKEKVRYLENEIENKSILLKAKDDEITLLQEKLFNLHTYINTLLVEKNKDIKKLSNGSIKSIDEKHIDSFHLYDSLSSQLEENKAAETLSRKPSKSLDEKQASISQIHLSIAVQTDTNDDEFSTSSSSHRNSCCEKYYKKCHSFQKKLELSRRQIQILEEEKASLREFRSSNSDLSLVEKTSQISELQLKLERYNLKLVEKSSQISELQSKLERKKSFISELKNELLKACNSLIDKEREVDNLKEELAKSETKYKIAESDLMKHLPADSPKAVDTNLKNLTNYKWTLIQKIFDLQRNFYEDKGIHLNYFDQFKDHINSLYSMQLAHSLSKSESLPLLSSLTTEQGCNLNDYKFKYLVSLELDIECLENLKIFLNRFFVPSVDQLMEESKTDEIGIEDVPRKSKLCSSKPKAALDSTENEVFSIKKFMWNLSQHIDIIKDFFDLVEECKLFQKLDLVSRVDEKASSLLMKILSEAKTMKPTVQTLFSLNVSLKKLNVFPKRLSKPDLSDQESVLSEDTITISRSDTPLSTDEQCPLKLSYSPSMKLKAETLMIVNRENRGIVNSGNPPRMKAMTLSSSCDSIHHRSQYSSPDLGIESDPNHESSVPEQKEKEISKYQKSVLDDGPLLESTKNTSECTTNWKGSLYVGDQLYSIVNLSDYELLKREIQESLVGIKSVLCRTGEGLHQIAKYTSPRKTLEYNTIKAIKDTCINVDVCLKEAYSLVGKFWTAHCPSEQEWNGLIKENQKLNKQIKKFKDMMQNQESEFKKAMEKLEHAQLLKSNMEKKISKKLVKTKKVIRQAELKLLETRCQNCPPVPKYSVEPSLQQGLE